MLYAVEPSQVFCIISLRTDCCKVLPLRAAHGFGLKVTPGLLRQTDDAFCKIKREWWLIEVEQIHQPFVLSPNVQAGAEQLFKQLQ